MQHLDGIGSGGIPGAKLLDFGHRVLYPGDKGGQGLVLLLPNRKKLSQALKQAPGCCWRWIDSRGLSRSAQGCPGQPQYGSSALQKANGRAVLWPCQL